MKRFSYLLLEEGPDWKPLRAIPYDPIEDLDETQKTEYDYAFVTDEPDWTRAASKEGWVRVIGQVQRSWTDTGLPSVLFYRSKNYNAYKNR